ELLLNQAVEGSPGKAWLIEIDKAGKRAASLTSQLLAFSRRQIMQPQLLDLNKVISESEQMLRRLMREDVLLKIVPGPDLARVRADRAQIEQVLINLVVNARDAMPNGGQLTIQTANVGAGLLPSGQSDGTAKVGRSVSLVVEDTGTGMDERTLSQVFEPFFTTKPVGTATGLGLSTVYGIVKQSGGEITATSVPGRGSRFEMLLPALEPGAETSPSDAGPSTSKGGKTILVIEDEAAVRQLVRDILTQAGYVVAEASSGKEALAFSTEFEGKIDLVVSDVVMPAMRGPQVVEELTRMRPNLPVLFMSGYSEDGLVPRGPIESGAGFIAKPFTPDEFLEAVRAVLVPAENRSGK
ncbi:MAG TPA: response regulator, partial [Blastocatellia bacterium]|nr:response regulator [Blastocatellia bacterium]